MRNLLGVIVVVLLCGCATQDSSEPHSVRLRFVPGAEPQSPLESCEGAVWMALSPNRHAQNGQLWLHANAGIGDKFPVRKEGGPELFQVTVTKGSDARLVVEVYSKEGTDTVELKLDAPVPIVVGGIPYKLLYPTVEVSSEAGRTETNKALILVTTPAEERNGE